MSRAKNAPYNFFYLSSSSSLQPLQSESLGANFIRIDGTEDSRRTIPALYRAGEESSGSGSGGGGGGGGATVSQLLIEKAERKDSGVYRCSPSNTGPDSITVHVIDGEL